MPIHYYLKSNHLTEEPNDYMAITVSNNKLEFEDVVNAIIERGSTVTKADIYSVLEDLNSVIEEKLSAGSLINLPIANFSFAVKGKFNSYDDSFDGSRHQVIPKLTPGKRLRKYFKNRIELKKEEAVKNNPNVVSFFDVSTATENNKITPNGLAKVLGYRLKFNQNNNDEGIFFLSESDSEFKVKYIGTILPTNLMFQIPPELTKGKYKLIIRSADTKKLKAGQLSTELTVD